MYQSAKEMAFKAKNKIAAVGVAGTLLVEQAQAALPAEATSAFSALSGNVTDVLAAVWPIVALGVGGFTLIKLFKKGASKAV